MKRLFAVSAFLALGTCVAFAGVSEGKTLFAQHCKACHGANGEGNPAIAKMFKVTMHPLSSKEVQSKSNAVLKKDITQGNGKMRPVRGLSDKQVDDVIAFVRSLKK